MSLTGSFDASWNISILPHTFVMITRRDCVQNDLNFSFLDLLTRCYPTYLRKQVKTGSIFHKSPTVEIIEELQESVCTVCASLGLMLATSPHQSRSYGLTCRRMSPTSLFNRYMKESCPVEWTHQTHICAPTHIRHVQFFDQS